MTEFSKTTSSKKRRRGRKDSGSVPVGGGATEYQAHKTPLVQLDEENSTWFDFGKKLPGRNDTTTTSPPQRSDQPVRDLVTKYRSIGDMIFQKEIQLVGRASTSDERWVENTMKKGTLKDRIAAMSVTISSDPIHKFYVLDGLLSMVGCSETGGKTNSRVAQLTAEALDDLFLNTFLPPDRKLITLSQRPLYKYEANKNGKKTQKTLSPRILLLWRFEEMVKEKYELYLSKYMQQTLHNGAEMQKVAILQSAGGLLSSVPEGESRLLSMMVNKLGDPSKKTASAAGHQLRLVLQEHPNMQLIVAREVQQLAHRAHLSPRALYNCIVFLNQLKLRKEDDTEQEGHRSLQDESLPASLLKTYFRLFEVAVKKKQKSEKDDPDSEENGMKSRLLSALLTGVNRAHPYLPDKDKDMEDHIDELYRVVHTAAPAAVTQALMLLFHLAVGSTTDDDESAPKKDSNSESDVAASRKDRFYRALYATLSKPTLVSNGKHLTMYFNLLYKSMKCDTDENRINAFAKRLMCTVIHSNPASIAGCGFLLNEIAKSHDDLRICLEEEPSELDAQAFLDDSKRDPRAAVGIDQNEAGTSRVVHPPSWELSLLAHHVHPSVAKFAGTIGEIDYAGDPLKDFGLAPFLDKFAYKNPKSQDKVKGHYKRGESIAERRSGTDGMIRARLELPVNDPAFLERESIDEQDEFFHKFFSERARRDELKGIKRGKKDDEMDEDEFDEAAEEALDTLEEAGGLASGKTFEEYERAWETDSEEEAFVDSLAQKLMEDAANGPVDYDDEDPDMDDWGDLYSDDDKGKDGPESDDEDEDEDDNVPDKVMAAYEGDEIDDEGNDDDVDVLDESDDESPVAKSPKGFHDDDDFMDQDDSDGTEDTEDDNLDEDPDIEGQYQSHSEEDDENSDDDLALLDSEEEDDSDDDDDSDDAPKKSRKKARTEEVFADADEYFERISKSFDELNKTSPSTKEAVPSKGKAKAKRRRRG